MTKNSLIKKAQQYNLTIALGDPDRRAKIGSLTLTRCLERRLLGGSKTRGKSMGHQEMMTSLKFHIDQQGEEMI